jgi:hypothetical protein
MIPGRQGWQENSSAYNYDPHVKDIEEGFTELGATQHAEQMFKAQGIDTRATGVIAPAPPGHLPTTREIYDVQDELRTLYRDAGKRGGKPGSMQSYTALSDAEHEMFRETPDPAKFAGYLLDARRQSPFPDLKARIGKLVDKLGITGGGATDNPEYDKARADLLAALDAASAVNAALPTIDKYASSRLLYAKLNLEKNYDPSGVAGVLDALGATEWASLHDHLDDISGKLDTLLTTPMSRHETMAEYARVLADPHRISDGKSWGHYPDWTAQAQTWVQNIARAERKRNVDRLGTPGYKRTVELADEINRQDAAGKVPAMARQLIRAMGEDPDTADPMLLADLEKIIKQQWGGGAYDAARNVALRRGAGQHKSRKTAAAAAEPVSAALTLLTPAGQQARAIIERAWAHPDTADDARAQLYRLALAATDPAELRQIQDAGQMLRRRTDTTS